MSANTFTLCTGILIAGLVSACGSGNDTTSPINSQATAEADSPSSDGTANGITVETAGDSNPVESDNSETEENATQEATDISGEGSTETDLANPQNDGEQLNTDSQQEQVIPEAEGSDTEQPIANNQRVNFGTAKLLVDLEPNGDSYAAKFQRVGDKLFFWTVDTNPDFSRCAPHWGALGDEDKNITFNLVATHPETGVVTMNKKIMTLGDFGEDPNYTCAGNNSTIMQVYKYNWITPLTATGEHQFVLQFGGAPDQVWITDGNTSNTSQLESGRINERAIFEGEKVFFVSQDGLSVSDTFSGNRRKLFETNGDWHDTNLITKSPARQATFEIRVGHNRYQIWTYDLDTDEWEKKFSIKTDTTYSHNQTLLVNGETLLSRGYDSIEYESVLGVSSNYGNVTSFDILTNSRPTISSTGPSGTENSNDKLFYSTTEFTVESSITSIWGYSEERIEKLFSISEPGLRDISIVTGHNGLIYVAGTRELQAWPNFSSSLELWSYDTQAKQLVKLSSDDWYAVKHNYPTPDESYVFRHLSTADGLIFLNLKEDSGRELWFTDGTPEGTQQLADINPGNSNSDPQSFYYSGDAIYFSADDGIHGREPWIIPVSR